MTPPCKGRRAVIVIDVGTLSGRAPVADGAIPWSRAIQRTADGA
jgi:hypothetical protein